MWSLPSRSLATALAAVVAILFVVQPASVEPLAAQSDCVSSTTRARVSASIHTPPSVNLIRNGDFAGGMFCWATFATPDPSFIVSQVNNGALGFYRVPQPQGERSNQAVIFQWTQTPLWENSPVHASFDLGNSSNVRKRISVLIHEDDFSDLRVCTFWLAPHSPLRTYRMRTHTSRIWLNTTLSFYAASPGEFGGFYDVDNVSLTYEPTGYADRTLCDDPTAPAPVATPNGPNLLGNGDFSAGMASWGVFHGLQHQISNGVFEFVWEPPPPPGPGVVPSYPSFQPAPVVIQRTGQAMPTGQILTAHVDLGNSSPVRKRVSLLIHQWDFDDLAACTFWLEPGTPLQTYTMRMFTTEPWSDAALSVYAATRGPETWIQLDNASLQRTSGADISGKECYEPSVEIPSEIEASIRQARNPEKGAPARGSSFADRVRGGRPNEAVRPASAPGGLVAMGSAQSMSLRYAVPPSAAELAVEVSEDGDSWQALHTVAPSDDWRILTLDLTEFMGRVMFVRVRGS
jgi:hypothetical protein